MAGQPVSPAAFEAKAQALKATGQQRAAVAGRAQRAQEVAVQKTAQKQMAKRHQVENAIQKQVAAARYAGRKSSGQPTTGMMQTGTGGGAPPGQTAATPVACPPCPPCPQRPQPVARLGLGQPRPRPGQKKPHRGMHTVPVRPKRAPQVPSAAPTIPPGPVAGARKNQQPAAPRIPTIHVGGRGGGPGVSSQISTPTRRPQMPVANMRSRPMSRQERHAPGAPGAKMKAPPGRGKMGLPPGLLAKLNAKTAMRKAGPGAVAPPSIAGSTPIVSEDLRGGGRATLMPIGVAPLPRAAPPGKAAPVPAAAAAAAPTIFTPTPAKVVGGLGLLWLLFL